MVVFSELAAHFEDFNVVHFLSEVTHFETLFDAVAVVVPGPDHRNFFAHGPVVVLNACVGSWLFGSGRHRSIELDRDGSSAHSEAGLNASLHIAESQRILHHLVLNIKPGVELSVIEHFEVRETVRLYMAVTSLRLVPVTDLKSLVSQVFLAYIVSFLHMRAHTRLVQKLPAVSGFRLILFLLFQLADGVNLHLLDIDLREDSILVFFHLCVSLVELAGDVLRAQVLFDGGQAKRLVHFQKHLRLPFAVHHRVWQDYLATTELVRVWW